MSTVVADIDECAYDPPICSQLCNNSASGFACSCVAGYRLADDRVHCVALPWKPDGPFLLYAQASAIYRVSVKHGASALPSVIYRSRGHVFSLGTFSKQTSDRFVTAPCGLWGYIKNRPAQFPERMSYKATGVPVGSVCPLS